MSPACENFIRAVLAMAWRDAFLNLNGLSRDEMLRAIAALDPLDRADLWTNHDSYAGTVNMPRIEYAYNVVKDGRVPASAPGDLQDTGQVGEAQSYLAHRPYLTFTNDLTGLLPTNNSGAATLSNGDFESVAVALGVEVAAIQAVAQVEAGGRHGFSGGRPI